MKEAPSGAEGRFTAPFTTATSAIMHTSTKWKLALAASVLLGCAVSAARAAGFDEDFDDGPDTVHSAVCAAIGCGGGSQPCADAKGTVKVGEGSVEVTYHCYERKAEE